MSLNRTTAAQLLKVMKKNQISPLTVVEGAEDENEVHRHFLPKESTEQAAHLTKDQLCQVDFWIASEFVYNLFNTLAKTGYTASTLVTDISLATAEFFGHAELQAIQPLFFGISPVGFGTGAVMAILCALAEARSHQATSQHFAHSARQSNDVEKAGNHVEDDFDNEAPKEVINASLNWKQSIWSTIHYISDVYDGITVPLLLSKLAGLDDYKFWQRGVAYAGMGLFSMLGNGQELKNTRIAFREENVRKTPGLK